jgi:GNAT superfamily N-acetyltransferase
VPFEPPDAILTLRDGTEVLVRPIRPEDAAVLEEAFERLSDRSRYQRFLSPMARLNAKTLHYLTDVDHHDHEALVAFDRETAQGLAVARYVRDRTQRDRAEAAVTVVDAWQGRGLGTLLLELLEGRAREEGINRFYALVLASNRDMLDVFARLGPTHELSRNQDTVEIEVLLEGEGLTPALRQLMIALRPRDE